MGVESIHSIQSDNAKSSSDCSQDIPPELNVVDFPNTSSGWQVAKIGKAWLAHTEPTDSPRTHVIRKRLVDRYIRWFLDKPLTRQTCSAFWLDSVNRHGRTSSVPHRETSWLRAMTAWAEACGLLDDDPMRKLKPVRQPPPTRRPIAGQEDYEKLKAYCLERGTWLYGLVIVLHDTGLRVETAARIKWSNFDLDRRILTVQEPKTEHFTRKPSIIPWSIGCDLDVWIKSHYETRQSEHWVFPEAETMTPASAANAMAWIVRKAGVNLTAHSFRRGLITRGISSGGNPMLIASMTGHSSIHQLMTYCIPDPEVVRKIHAAADAFEKNKTATITPKQQ